MKQQRTDTCIAYLCFQLIARRRLGLRSMSLTQVMAMRHFLR